MRFLILVIGVALWTATPVCGEDWSQWRGARRDGVAGGPPLINALPETGLKALWRCESEIKGARSGGWSSPVIAGGKLFLFSHSKTKLEEKELPPKKYPYLPPEKRGGMSDKEYEEYERNRRDEDFERSKSFRYDEQVACLDARTGKVLWQNEHPSIYTRFPQSGTPAVVDGRVLILGAGLVARAIDAETGKDVWSKKLPGNFRDEFLQSSFAVADGVAAVLAGHFFGLNPKTGDIVWQSESAGELDRHCSPIAWSHDGQSYFIVNMDGGETVCVVAKTGKELWRVKSDGGHSTPVIVGDRMLTYGNSRKKGLKAYKISPAGAELLWTYQGLADPGSSPVVVGDFVYVQGEKRLACVDLATGHAAWTEGLDLNQPRYTSLVAADKKVIYAFDGILCFAADSNSFRRLMDGKIDDTGLLADEAAFRKMLNIDQLEKTSEGQKQAEKIWHKKFNDHGPLPCATPAIVDGKLFVRTKGGVVCYDLSGT